MKGLLITQIDPDSKLTDGLQPGDIVMGINGKRIDDIADEATALMLAEGRHVVFYIWRNGELLHVAIRMK